MRDKAVSQSDVTEQGINLDDELKRLRKENMRLKAFAMGNYVKKLAIVPECGRILQLKPFYEDTK